MIFAILTLLVALSISAIAAYYSIVGLAAIFAAAVLPIILMGVVLEIGKITATVWLHTFWKKAPALTKIYLTSAVVILMFITSMGIFGFLSKSHIEQTAQSEEQVAQISTIKGNIERSQAKVNRWTSEIDRISTGVDTRVDNLVDKEQKQLDNLYVRIDKEKDKAREQADKNIKLQNDRIEQAKNRKSETLDAIEQKYRNSFSSSSKAKEIDQANKNELSVASSAQREIRNIQRILRDQLDAIDKKYAPQVNAITTRINDLRNQANTKTDDIEGRVNELEALVLKEQKTIDGYRAEKNKIESSYRQLEAEVGPIKYIAEFIYGEDADRNLLEEAVRWVIIIIVVVFDPLAIMLVLAASMQIRWMREEKIKIRNSPENRQNRIEELEMKIEEYNEFLKKLEAELDRLVADDKAKASHIEELEKTIDQVNADKEKAIAELEALMADKENKLNLKITEQEETIEELRAKIDELLNREPEIKEVEVEVEKIVEDETKIKAAEELRRQKEAEAKELEKQVKARDAAMERLNEKYKLIPKEELNKTVQKPDTQLESIIPEEALMPVADEDDDTIPPAAFGSVFPTNPVNGQLFTKTDVFPHVLYKWNDKKWITVDKDGTDSYLTEDYIRHLVEAVAKGETELEDLSEQEKQEMTDFLKK
tara:strand:- start:7800 stop:9758 length:1959 start_codon:yes stop_codon:yes gene_type:complete